MGQETGCCLIECIWLIVFTEGLQSNGWLGCSQLKVQLGKNLLPSSLGLLMGLKTSTSDRAHWSCSARYLIIWQLTSIPPKQATCEKEQEHIKRVSEHPTQSHNLLVTHVTQSSPSSREEIIYMQGITGKHLLCITSFLFSQNSMNEATET